jgi:hypothetical protein
MLIKHQIQNKFEISTAQTITISGGTSNLSYKSIVLPLNLNAFPTDYGDDVQDIVVNERNKAINKDFDTETIKYTFLDNTANLNNGLVIQFRFWDQTASTFTTFYNAVDITNDDINKSKNGFKKSFFRLYFYDSNSGETNNLIFTEDINVKQSLNATFSFNELYWLRTDDFFNKNNLDRTVYMDARFFNAKTGKINKFINPNPLPMTPMSILDYSNPNNREWRTSAIVIQNPKTNNGLYNFYPKVPYGSNTINTITMSEAILL